jgi:hypothetical protein
MGNLVSVAAEIEKIHEFTTDKDITRYAQLVRRFAQEVYLRTSMDAEVIQATLSEYRGRWFEFGVGNKVRAKIVAAHLKVGAEGVKVLGVAAIRMDRAFQRHFVKPEHDARRARARGKARDFRIEE